MLRTRNSHLKSKMHITVGLSNGKMAAWQHGASSTTSALRHRRFIPGKTYSIKPFLLISSFSASFPAKPTRRKNHLRQKIRKTLKKPIIPKLPPATPIIPIDSPPQEIEETNNIQEFDKSESSEAGNEEVQKLEELSEIEGSVPVGVSVDGSVGVFPKNSVLKYGLWLVGAFVFQTVCAVWFFGSTEIENRSEILNGSGESRVKVDLNGNGKMGLRNSAIDSIVYVDELEMERKIEEIRVMAREARAKERLELKRNGVDSEESEEFDEGKYFKSGIEEEVDNRLVMLRKKLGNARLKMPVASVGYSRKETEKIDEVEKGELDDRESDGALLFKKKYKFKGLSDDPIEKPKGFGSDDTRVKSGNLGSGHELFRSGNGDNNAVGLRDGEKQAHPSGDDSKGIDAGRVVEKYSKKETSEMNRQTRKTRKKMAKERGTSKQGKEKVVAEPKMIDGFALKKNNGGSPVEPVKSRKLNGEAVNLRKSSALDAAVVSNKLSEGNDTLRGKGAEDTESAIKSESENDIWWLNLPYVLAILMRRGDDGEGGEGLYTLRSVSSTEDWISHMVAFEDRADATNFCYLLLSFFEDLEDFKADVVPLTVKELNEAVKLYNKRVLVVKRGELQLYAGQPLTDAEMALRAMIEHG